MADVEKLKTIENNVNKSGPLIGVRHMQFVLLFLAIFMGYGMRVNMSVGIVAMTDDNPPDPSITTYPEWTNTDIILSSFFWGYAVCQIGAGQLSLFFGPKWFLVIAMTISSLFSLLIPVMANVWGSTGVIICRVVQGLTQGFLYPSTHHLISRWSPINERSIVVTLVYGGATLGTVVSIIITGFASNSRLGWPLAFYLYGVFSLAWVLVWAVLGCNSPSVHKSITQEEKLYIGEVVEEDKKLITPWKSIFTSMPFYATLISCVGSAWGFWTLFTEIPTYLTNIMKLDIKDNSLLSSLPYLTLWLLCFVTGPVANKIIKDNILSTTAVRVIFQSVGSVVPAAALIWLGFIENQKVLGIILLMVAVGSASAHGAGYQVNQIDLAPNFAGTLLGLANTLGTFCSIFAPLTVGFIGRDESDPILWRIVFCIAAGFYIVSTIFYAIFASGEMQPWNNLEYDSDARTKKRTQEVI